MEDLTLPRNVAVACTMSSGRLDSLPYPHLSMGWLTPTYRSGETSSFFAMPVTLPFGLVQPREACRGESTAVWMHRHHPGRVSRSAGVGSLRPRPAAVWAIGAYWPSQDGDGLGRTHDRADSKEALRSPPASVAACLAVVKKPSADSFASLTASTV